MSFETVNSIVYAKSLPFPSMSAGPGTEALSLAVVRTDAFRCFPAGLLPRRFEVTIHAFYNKEEYLSAGKERIMAEATIKIDGMSCQHCVMRVKKAIDGLAGVKSSQVEVGKASVSFDESQIQKKDIENAITKAGYKVVG
jgi:copper chaperone